MRKHNQQLFFPWVIKIFNIYNYKIYSQLKLALWVKASTNIPQQYLNLVTRGRHRYNTQLPAKATTHHPFNKLIKSNLAFSYYIYTGCDNSRTYVPEVRQYHSLVLPCFQLSTTQVRWTLIICVLAHFSCKFSNVNCTSLTYSSLKQVLHIEMNIDLWD